MESSQATVFFGNTLSGLARGFLLFKVVGFHVSPEEMGGRLAGNRSEASVETPPCDLYPPENERISPENQWLEDVFPIEIVPF